MDSTPFSKKVEILYDVYIQNLSTYEEFVSDNDIGVPAAVLLHIGAVNLTDKGTAYIEETWDDLCDFLEIDPYGNYSSIQHMENFSREG